MGEIAQHVLHQEARKLVERVANNCDSNTSGSPTIAIYDTAWVSMIAKGNQWLFPECFCYIVAAQSSSGGWESSDSLDDDLLNTLASLKTMALHSRLPLQCADIVSHDLQERISRAISYADDKLQDWDIDSVVNVGFEFLFPTLLSMLEDEHIQFDFPGRKSLDEVKASKMERFDEKLFYKSPDTFLHSLEGLVGRIDFDRVAHHKTFGSMMGSPASTAAYLIHSSRWDDEAQRYLQSVISEGAGDGKGSVPSVYPIPVFESTWVITTLLGGGYTVIDLGENKLKRIGDYLQDISQEQGGLLGFAPSVPNDADDTAKTLQTLSLLGRRAEPKQMVEFFSTDDGYFRTYPGERNASFSANCNALMALLHATDTDSHADEVVSTTRFLCDIWWKGAIKDKWNSSSQYSRMLLAEALIRLLHLWDTGHLSSIPDLLLRERIPVVLIQILNQTLFAQTENGGWELDGCCETTAYGLLTLETLNSLPWHSLLHECVMSSMGRGHELLTQSRSEWAKPAAVWIEKVRYGSATLSEAYCLAAMNASRKPSLVWSNRMVDLMDIPEKLVTEFTGFFSTLPGIRSEPIWKLKASAIEACTFLPQLKSARADILPRQKEAKNQYVAYIPFTWISVNNLYNLHVGADQLWNMMVLTVCNFRVDEYMETAVARFPKADLEQTKHIVHHLCTDEHSDGTQAGEKRRRISANNENSNGFKSDDPNAATSTKVNGFQANGVDAVATEANERYTVLSAVSFRAFIGHYTRAMLAYPGVQGASAADRSRFQYLLRTFLLSQIDQITDNSLFSTQPSWTSSIPSVIRRPRTSFYDWLHATGADSVSCPFSFAFFACLIGAASAPLNRTKHRPTADCFDSVLQKYFAEELCLHLAVMSRLYNDFGSAARDRQEGNINSINFPEFHKRPGGTFSAAGDASSGCEKNLKAELLQLAEHERQCVEMAQTRLLSEMEGKPGNDGFGRQKQKANAVRLFVGVANLYADVYVARDLSNPIKKDG